MGKTINVEIDIKGSASGFDKALSEGFPLKKSFKEIKELVDVFSGRGFKI